jgi:hypothetical protein
MRELLNNVLSKIITGKKCGAFNMTQSECQSTLSKHWHLEDPKYLTWQNNKSRQYVPLSLISGVFSTLNLFHKAKESTRLTV